jgi:hypothetical protein
MKMKENNNGNQRKYRESGASEKRGVSYVAAWRGSVMKA